MATAALGSLCLRCHFFAQSLGANRREYDLRLPLPASADHRGRHADRAGANSARAAAYLLSQRAADPRTVCALQLVGVYAFLHNLQVRY